MRNVRILDRAARGREAHGVLTREMDTLRSPKHLTGPDLGVPSLTFRAWYEAQHGADSWRRLYEVATKDWLGYLLWVRHTVGLSLENNTEVTRLDPGPDGMRVELSRPAGAQSIFARKVVLAGGRDGSGSAYRPSFPLLAADGTRQSARVFHSSDHIDFRSFKGGKIAVLGASGSAFDNAAVALESGAAAAHVFVRRAQLPQINTSKWAGVSGVFSRFSPAQGLQALADLQLYFSRGGTATAPNGAAPAFRRALARRRAIASSLFVASADALRSQLWQHEDRELEPSRYFRSR